MNVRGIQTVIPTRNATRRPTNVRRSVLLRPVREVRRIVRPRHRTVIRAGNACPIRTARPGNSVRDMPVQTVRGEARAAVRPGKSPTGRADAMIRVPESRVRGGIAPAAAVIVTAVIPGTAQAVYRRIRVRGNPVREDIVPAGSVIVKQVQPGTVRNV